MKDIKIRAYWSYFVFELDTSTLPQQLKYSSIEVLSHRKMLWYRQACHIAWTLPSLGQTEVFKCRSSSTLSLLFFLLGKPIPNSDATSGLSLRPAT